MTLKESLMTIKDFRIDRCKKHNLCDILMIVLIGYLTGCKDMEEIHFSAEVSEEMLRNISNFQTEFQVQIQFLEFLRALMEKNSRKFLRIMCRKHLVPESQRKKLLL